VEFFKKLKRKINLNEYFVSRVRYLNLLVFLFVVQMSATFFEIIYYYVFSNLVETKTLNLKFRNLKKKFKI
jgi:hypothetical protein